MIYRYERRGRRHANLLTLAGIWGIVFITILTLNMAWWIAAIILMFTLPALIDYISDTRAWVEVRQGRIVWSALNAGDRADIDHVRLDRRFDGGIRITLIHVGGAHTRLPPDISPPVEAFETALGQAGIAAQRHPFSVF